MSTVRTAEQMLEEAKQRVVTGTTPTRLHQVALSHRDRWDALVIRQAAGEHLDGRVSIYNGETYLEARDRWEAYRLLLVAQYSDHLKVEAAAAAPVSDVPEVTC